MQWSLQYTQLCIYRKAFVFKPISTQLKVYVECNLSFVWSLNTSYLEMDGQSSVDWTPSKTLPPLFPSLTLHGLNLLLWKKILTLILFKIITVSRPSTPLRVFLTGVPKILNPSLLLDVTHHQKLDSCRFPSRLTPSLLWSQTTY